MSTDQMIFNTIWTESGIVRSDFRMTNDVMTDSRIVFLKKDESENDRNTAKFFSNKYCME